LKGSNVGQQRTLYPVITTIKIGSHLLDYTRMKIHIKIIQLTSQIVVLQYPQWDGTRTVVAEISVLMWEYLF